MKKITSLLMMFMLFIGTSWAQLPVTLSDVAKGEYHYYAIKSTKNNKYVFASVGSAARLTSDKNAPHATWYFLPGQGDKVIIKNCADTTLNVTGDAVLSASEPGQYIIGLQSDKTDLYYISKDGSNGWNDANGWGNMMGSYGKNDGGSSLQFEEVASVPVNVMPEEIIPGKAYTIRSGRTGKFLAYVSGNDTLQQHKAISDRCYFYFEGDESGYTIINTKGGRMNTSGNYVVMNNGDAKWTVSKKSGDATAKAGALYLKNGNNHLNAYGGLDNLHEESGKAGLYGSVDAGDEWILTEAEIAGPAMEEQWNQASTEVEANGIKFSAINGDKYYYTLESLRQNFGYRYASLVGNVIRTVNPNSDANLWYFLRGKDAANNGVVIVNAFTGLLLNGVNGTTSFDHYTQFYLVDSEKNPGYKCISNDPKNISGGNHCIDAANQQSNGVSAGWNDEKGGGTAWSINPVDVQSVAMAAIEGNGVVGTDMTHIATFSSNLNVVVPTGAEVYTVAPKKDNQVSLVQYKGRELPANTGVVVLSNEATVDFVPVFMNVAPVADNLMKAVSNNQAVEMTAADYVLASLEGTTQFYKANGSLALNKAYLALPTANANALVLNFGGEATGIEGVEAEENVNAPIYDLSGRRVNNLVKGGIYIQNGKKFIVK